MQLNINWSVGPRRPSDQSDANVALWLYTVPIYLYFCLVVGSDLVFTVFGLAPSATALLKRSTRAQMF